MSHVYKQSYGDQETDLDRNEDNSKECSHAGQEIEFIDLPYEDSCVNVDKTEYRRYNDGREDCVWGVLEERCYKL